jgi:hypothetical protein
VTRGPSHLLDHSRYTIGRLRWSRLPLLVALLAHGVFADDLPRRFTFDRYAAMLNKSPFAVATAVAVPAQTPSFMKDLYIANAARIPGEDLVTVMSSSDKAVKEFLSTKGPNEHGYSIANIEWSDRPGETKVTISKDGQFATLTFNQALMVSAPGPPGMAPPPPGVPSAMPTPVPNYVPPKPANVPGYPMPSPHVRGVIQRNPNVAPTPNVAPPPRPRPTVNPATNADDDDE